MIADELDRLRGVRWPESLGLLCRTGRARMSGGIDRDLLAERAAAVERHPRRVAGG